MNGPRITRRALLGGAISALGLLALKNKFWLFPQSTSIPCQILGANSKLGHKIFQKDLPPVSSILKTDVVIIGAGIAGLTAGRKLKKSGLNDFIVLELSDDIGGNSQAGHTQFGAHPWGAHYLPIPSHESSFLYEFLEESGVITGYDLQQHPIYNEDYLCHDLEERLFINGRFQEGLVPHHGVPEADKQEIRRFFNLMDDYRFQRGHDNKMAFCIPLQYSSQDPKLLQLDKMSMSDFLDQHEFRSSYLRWYVNYCCRDDYGAGIEIVSAWAGIHYFASRRVPAPYKNANLTWPEGNSFLVQKLASSFVSQIKTQILVNSIIQENEQIIVTAYDAKKHHSFEIRAKAVICATPQFITQRICKDIQFPKLSTDYYPWLVANLECTSVPESLGKELAWDNVNYYSPSLGYIDAAHQRLEASIQGRNLTYYRPMDNRLKMLKNTSSDWRELILADLRVLHPGLEKVIQSINIWIWGHGMICPKPNYLWHSARRHLPAQHGSIFFAHSDRSGISIFEEAYIQGLEAAENLIYFLKRV